MTKKLKPCPFCGGEAEVLSCRLFPHNYFPSCKGDIDEFCPGIQVEQDEQGGTHLESSAKELAIKLWNTRKGENQHTLSVIEKAVGEEKRSSLSNHVVGRYEAQGVTCDSILSRVKSELGVE